MRGTGKAVALQGGHGLRIRRSHGTNLQMAARQLIGDSGYRRVDALGKAQPLALVFLGIGKARVHG